MSISKRTRKILWARSGNRCAICKSTLVFEESDHDYKSIIGEECHIISPKQNGPRYDPDYPKEGLNSYDNLILLCRKHHKLIDDHPEKYPVETLIRIKKEHEKWVEDSLSRKNEHQQIKIRRIRKNIPEFLIRIQTGKDLMKIITNACAFEFDHDVPETEEETELLASFFQNVQDWGDIITDLEAGERVRVGFLLNQLIQELEEAGFWVFGAREMQKIEGGKLPPSDWPVAILRVVRKTNEEIAKIEFRSLKDKNHRNK